MTNDSIFYLKLPTPLNKGLSSYQLKIIAVIFMTFGHIVMTWDVLVPFISDNRFILEGLCRFSTFLFLYTAVESGHYTHSKTKLLARLYIAGLLVSIFNLLLREHGVFANFNIFYDIFYTLLYCFIFEHLYKSVKSRNFKGLFLSFMGLAITILPEYINKFVGFNISDMIPNASIDMKFSIVKATKAVFANPLSLEYGLLYVLIGLLWYFVRNRKWQCIMLVVLSIISFIGNYYSSITGETFGGEAFYTMFLDGQYLMVLAVPFIFLYNGEQGKKSRWFFYLYYPFHNYIIIFIAYFLSK